MKKQLILGSFLALAGIMNAQQWQQLNGNQINTGGWNPNNNTNGVEYLGTNNNYDLIIKTNAVENMRVTAGGNVGIGGTPVNRKLEVYPSGLDNGIEVLSGIANNNQDAALVLNNRTSGGHVYWISSLGSSHNPNIPGALHVWDATANASRLLIAANGNIGLGTQLPAQQLHTTGGVRFTGLNGTTPSGIIGIDGSGDLSVIAGGVGISNVCTTQDFIPKVDPNGTGNLICSQIEDDGTTVGIGSPANCSYNFPGQPGWLTGFTNPTSGNFNAKLCVNGVTKGLAFWATSDERFKKEIHAIDNPLSIVKRLEGKTYFWRTEEFKNRNFDGARQVGFIAQELEKIVPEAVFTDGDGYKSVNYDMIIPILVEAIKEQQKQLDEQKELINAQGNNKTGNATGISELNSDGFALDQNIPNPFSSETVINYTLPQQVKNASLIVYDLTGKQLISFPLELNAKSITITSEKLSAGIYIYSVMADGKIMDSKRMVVADKQ